MDFKLIMIFILVVVILYFIFNRVYGRGNGITGILDAKIKTFISNNTVIVLVIFLFVLLVVLLFVLLFIFLFYHPKDIESIATEPPSPSDFEDHRSLRQCRSRTKPGVDK